MSTIEFLDLSKQPIANNFLKSSEDFSDEYFYHLKVSYDSETHLVSIVDFVPPEMMFNESYVYHSSMSHTMRNHFKNVAKSLKEDLTPSKVLEIGSNDGVFIKHFDPKITWAVEPCGNFADLTNNMGYKTYSDFWSTELARTILDKDGKMDLIFSANCICHIQDLKDTFDAVSLLLNDDGTFVFEDPSLVSVITKNCYDQFYDEHAHIFSVIALQNLLNQSDLEIYKIEKISVHGVSNRIYAKKKCNKNLEIDASVYENVDLEKSLGLDNLETYLKFADRVYKSKEDLSNLLKSLKNDNKKIVSYGATCKSVTIFNFCEIDSTIIEYVTDTTPARQNKFLPGVHIPVISPEDGFNDSVDVAFLGAWNFSKEILEKEKDFIERGGIFITHVPNVRILR